MVGGGVEMVDMSRGGELGVLEEGGVEEKKIRGEGWVWEVMLCDEEYGELGGGMKCKGRMKRKREGDGVRKGVSRKVIEVIGREDGGEVVRGKLGRVCGCDWIEL